MRNKSLSRPLAKTSARAGAAAVAALALGGMLAACGSAHAGSSQHAAAGNGPAAASQHAAGGSAAALHAPGYSAAAAVHRQPVTAVQGLGGTLAFGYTGHTETVTVPDHAGYAKVTVSGAQGGDDQAISSVFINFGQGATISGSLPVKPGDTLTIGVGGQGADPDGNKSPGGGGWSVSPYDGGRGGSGHGSQTYDGGGGGGASVIQLNGQDVVVAAGGGGEGGATTHGGEWFAGGYGGAAKGYAGNYRALAGDVAGDGGSSSEPSLDKSGGSYSGALLKGGGGGGGGGRYPGGGGDASVWGGGGGGGGASLYDALKDVTYSVGSTCGATCHPNGNLGNGSVSITWLPQDDTSTVYAFQKTDAPLTQLLEVNDASTDNGAAVDTWRRTLNSDGTIQANQQWAYKFNGTTGEGQIVNASSGKCLELNRSDAKIDQWDCIDGADNEQWKLVPNPGGGTALQINLTAGPDGHPGTYYLATTTDPATMTDGTPLTLATSQNDRTAWEPLKQTG
jgi:Ricin-type beta-trefoil lectin domain-like/Glycine rich protein